MQATANHHGPAPASTATWGKLVGTGLLKQLAGGFAHAGAWSKSAASFSSPGSIRSLGMEANPIRM